MLSPFHLKRLGVFPASLRDIEPFVRKCAAHAAKHAAVDLIADRRFHDAPCRRRGKEHRLLCAEQRLKLWMNPAVEILKVFAAVSNQRTRKRCPRFFGNFNGTGNEKFVMRMHGGISNIEPAFAKLRHGTHRIPTLKAEGLGPPLPAGGERIEVRGQPQTAFRKTRYYLEWIVVDRARLLRKKATEPERIFWRHLRNRNFAANIRSTITSWISIVRAQSWLSNWTAEDITTVQVKFAIERARNSSRAMESSCCDSGIIRFAKSSTVFCEQSGWHSKSDRKTIPHLHPLPLGKGEARKRA